eukprot:354682-Chlamydomonas_euryale.AAC.10
MEIMVKEGRAIVTRPFKLDAWSWKLFIVPNTAGGPSSSCFCSLHHKPAVSALSARRSACSLRMRQEATRRRSHCSLYSGHVPGNRKAITPVPQARYLGLMTVGDPSQNLHLHRHLAAAGNASEDPLSALQRRGRMRSRLRRASASLLEECTMLRQSPLVSARSAYLRQVTSVGRRPDGTLHPTAQMCAAARLPQLMHSLNVARLARLGHMARMPGGSVVKQLLFAGGAGGTEWSGQHATLHAAG